MQIRPIQPGDLDFLDEIDATIQTDHYLHVDRAASAMSVSFRIDPRPLTERRSESNPLSDELRFLFKQIATGNDEGFCHIVEINKLPTASAIATQDGDLVELIDLRVDFDRRREGLGSALLFHVIHFARERACRALRCHVRSGNQPFNQMLAKLGFEIAGIDTQRYSNHDLVKEQTTLIWYLSLE